MRPIELILDWGRLKLKTGFSDDLLFARFIRRFLMLPFDVFAQETAALVRPEFGVEALFFEEFGVAAFFDDAAFVQDDEP